MSHDHSAAAGREPVTEAGRALLALGLAENLKGLGDNDTLPYRVARAVLAIEAEAVAAERSRVRLLMEQGSGDGLEDGTFTLPASVAREIVEP